MKIRHCNNLMDFRRIARRRLPAPVFHYLDGGADDEIALDRSTQAFADYELLPSQLSDVSNIDLRSTIFGQEVDWPVMIAPTGASKLFHGAGEADAIGILLVAFVAYAAGGSTACTGIAARGAESPAAKSSGGQGDR